MKLSLFCIQRPVFSIVISLLLMVVGVICFHRLSVRGYPYIPKPVLSVITTYTGASAQVIDNTITTPIENQLAALSGVDSMQSISRQGNSRVILSFNSSVNVDSAADEVRSLLGGRFVKHLPEGSEPPVVQKHDPNSQTSIIFSLHDAKMSDLALSDYAERVVVPMIQRTEGVASVSIWGDRQYAMRIQLDPMKMASQQVSVNDITQALMAQNVSVASGEIKQPDQYFPVFASGQLHDAKAFNQLVLRDTGGYVLRLADVARAHIGAVDTDSAMRIDGQKALGLAVYTESTANPISVSDRIQKHLSRLRTQLPPGMRLNVVYDNAHFLRQALHGVYRDLMLAIALVIVVVWLFLGDWRSAFIPIVTIPICLISVFSCLLAAGMTINVFTLLALLLAVGLVVDDAIVVLENASQHVSRGLSAMAAAKRSSQEIGVAVVAMTITLAAVYAPLAFAQHTTGVVFREFAFTLAMAVIISGVVALTLSPMMCAYLLSTKREGRYHQCLDQTLKTLQQRYRRLLTWVLGKSRVFLLLLLLCLMVGVMCYMTMAKTLVPTEDMGTFNAEVVPPVNASFLFVNHYSKQLGAAIKKLPGVAHVMMFDGAQSANAWVILKPYQDRKISAQTLQQKLRKITRQMPGAQVLAYSRGTIGGGGWRGNSIRLAILSDSDYAVLAKRSEALIKTLSAWPSISSVTQSLQMNDQQYRIDIDASAAASAHVNVGDISTALQTMLGGAKVTAFNWRAKDYDVILQVPERDLSSLSIIGKLYIRNRDNLMVPLSSLATIVPEVSASSLRRVERQHADMLTIQAAQGSSMGVIVKQLKQFMHAHLPETDHIKFYGMARDLLQSSNTLFFVFCMALVFIYLILAAQFESFIDPLVILFSVPLSIVGALCALKLAGASISIYSGIGFVTLIGLVSKHGILITNFANQLRARGESLEDALLQAAVSRLRPILMTTLSMVVGAMPLIFAQGANAKGLREIGWVVVGGLSVGTFFSLFVVPMAYRYLGRWRKIKRQTQSV